MGKVLVGLLSFSVCAISAAQSQIVLTLNSPPGEWIGGGQNWTTTYTPTTPGFYLSQVVTETAGAPSYVRFLLGTSSGVPYNTFSMVDFASNKLGVALTPGLYPQAQRASFADPGFAGLDVSWQNRGSNTLTGWFRVNKFVYSGTTGNFAIQEFDADFGQISDGGPLEMTGNLRMTPVPEPITMIGLVGGLAVLARRRAAR
jgi:hypothetical protein